MVPVEPTDEDRSTEAHEERRLESLEDSVSLSSLSWIEAVDTLHASGSMLNDDTESDRMRFSSWDWGNEDEGVKRTDHARDACKESIIHSSELRRLGEHKDVTFE